MAGLLNVLVLATLGSLLTAGFSDACSCRMRSVKQRYCSADYVIKATLANRTEDGYLVTYKLTVLDNYKPSAEFDMANMELSTVKWDSLCGFGGVEGRPYILFGAIEPDNNGGTHLTTNLCSGNVDVTLGDTHVLSTVQSKPNCDAS